MFSERPSPSLWSRAFGAPGSARAWNLFDLGFRPWLSGRLAEVRVETAAELPESGRVLLVANHTSWYDGFLLRALHRTLRPQAPLRTLMLSRELRKAPLLRWIGGTGFTPEEPATLRGALRELRHREREDALIGFFPQGHIFPATRRPLGFRRGVELVARVLEPAVIVPVALRLEMGNQTKPTAWVLAGPPEPVESEAATPLAKRLEVRVQGLLDELSQHLDHHGEAPPQLWPRQGPKP